MPDPSRERKNTKEPRFTQLPGASRLARPDWKDHEEAVLEFGVGGKCSKRTGLCQVLARDWRSLWAIQAEDGPSPTHACCSPECGVLRQQLASRAGQYSVVSQLLFIQASRSMLLKLGGHLFCAPGTSLSAPSDSSGRDSDKLQPHHRHPVEELFSLPLKPSEPQKALSP